MRVCVCTYYGGATGQGNGAAEISTHTCETRARTPRFRYIRVLYDVTYPRVRVCVCMGGEGSMVIFVDGSRGGRRGGDSAVYTAERER